jgi:hypothetical protein
MNSWPPSRYFRLQNRGAVIQALPENSPRSSSISSGWPVAMSDGMQPSTRLRIKTVSVQAVGSCGEVEAGEDSVVDFGWRSSRQRLATVSRSSRMPEPNTGDRTSHGSRVDEFRTAKLRRGSPDVCPGPGCGEDDQDYYDFPMDSDFRAVG